MRLSDVLSKPPKDNYIQIEGFLQNKKGTVGQKVEKSSFMRAWYCLISKIPRDFWFWQLASLQSVWDHGFWYSRMGAKKRERGRAINLIPALRYNLGTAFGALLLNI